MTRDGGSTRDVRVRLRAAAGWLVAVAVGAAACSAGPAASVGTSTPPSSATPAATTAGPPSSSDPQTSAAPLGPVSISSILGTAPAEPPPDTTWVRVSDAGVPFSFEVPSSWGNAAGYPWDDAGRTVGWLLAAGPDPSRIGTDFAVPGVVVGISSNPTGQTPLAMVEADDYSSVCTATPAEDASNATILAAYRAWESCGPGRDGYLLVIAIVPPDASGLIAVVLQGDSAEDVAYLDHILASLVVGGGSAATPEPVTGQAFSISIDECLNQHGSGVAIGVIRNEDAQLHVFYIEVWFLDATDVLLGEGSWTTADLPPGQATKYDIRTPAIGSGAVTCQIHDVQVQR